MKIKYIKKYTSHDVLYEYSIIFSLYYLWVYDYTVYVYRVHVRMNYNTTILLYLTDTQSTEYVKISTGTSH